MGLPLFPFALAVGYFAGYTDSFFDPVFLTILFFWNLLLFLPAIILHIIYYTANRNTKLEIDEEKQALLVIDDKRKYLIEFDNIKKVQRVIYSDYKHPKWQQNWQPMPWRNYGYLKLITKDNEVFLFTSLMLDPLNPPIEFTETKFRFIQLLDELVEEEFTKEELVNHQRDEVDAYKKKFQFHSEEELRKKTIYNGIKEVAAIAANELLEERNTIANKP
jgi:hypothetical protein